MSEAGAGYFARKSAFNAAQGYRIDYKYLGMAYGIEVAVVATSLLSAWFFAKLYGHGDSTTMAMMMLAPIAYAGVEIARVPLALALRTQPNVFWKLLFAVMVLCAVAVSVKSLSQLGEVMFRPRLIDVTRATAALKDAQSAQASYAGKVAAADAAVGQRTTELATAEHRLAAVNSELGALPADRCARVWRTNTQGHRYSSQECHADGRQKVMSGNLADAEKARADASNKLDDARRSRDALDPTAAAAAVSASEVKLRDAVLNSQLHSFTGMFYGKDPTEVTEAELHSFLRIFVFFPAIFASLAATALALASVTPLKHAPAPVEVDELDLVDHLLGPLTRSLDVHARKAASEAVAQSMALRERVEPTAPDLPDAVPAEVVAASKLDETPAAATSPAAAAPAASAPAASAGSERPVADGKPMRPTLVATTAAAPAATPLNTASGAA